MSTTSTIQRSATVNLLYNTTTIQIYRSGCVIVGAFTDAAMSDIITAFQNIGRPGTQVRSLIWNFTDTAPALISVDSSSVYFIQVNPWGLITDTSKHVHGSIVYEINN